MFGAVLGLFGMECVNWIGASFIVHFGWTHPSTYYLKISLRALVALGNSVQQCYSDRVTANLVMLLCYAMHSATIGM